MREFEEKEYHAFNIFQKHWALVTTGCMEKFNSCTVGWGSMGNIWSGPGTNRPVITVYLYPTRYTRTLMQENGFFTVSFYPENCRRALAVMGNVSGRDKDKVQLSHLTPMPMGESVTYEEANLTFLCRKLYQHQMTKEDLATDIQEYYAATPEGYPVDENGDWHPHWVFIGEVVDVLDKR